MATGDQIPIKSILVFENGQQLGQVIGLDFQGDTSVEIARNILQVSVTNPDPAAPDQSFQINDGGIFGAADGIVNDPVNLRPKLTNDIEWANGINLGVLEWNPTAARILTLPDATDVLVGRATVDTLTNKAIDADLNTITDIRDANVAVTAAIAGTKISPDFGAQNIITTGSALLGPTPISRASTGIIRIANNASVIVGRRADDLADLVFMAVDGVNNMYLACSNTGSNQFSTCTILPATSGLLGAAATPMINWTDAGMFLGTTNPGFGSGSRVFALQNALAAPSTDPSGGGILYSEGGALKWRGSSGTVTTIAAA